jgi:DNA-binding HxlR family transcriptional regulator
MQRVRERDRRSAVTRPTRRRVEHSFTDQGRGLGAVIDGIEAWAGTWLAAQR